MRKLGLFFLFCLVAVGSVSASIFTVTGDSNKTNNAQTYANVVQDILNAQCTNPAMDTFGSFDICTMNNLTGATGININLRQQEAPQGESMVYINDSTGRWTGNNTVLGSAVIGIDALVRGVADVGANATYECSENGGWKQSTNSRVCLFFTGGAFFATYDNLNSTIENLAWRNLLSGDVYSNQTLYINFNNGTAVDLSGNNRSITQTVSAINYSLGYEQQGARFNGVGDNLNLGNVFSVNGGSISMCAWVQSGNTGSLKYLFSKYPAAAKNYEAAKDTNDKLFFTTRNASVTVTTYSTSVLSANYTFLCFVYNGTSANQSIYFNAVLENSSIGASGDLSNAANFVIGARSTGSNAWNGGMDQIYVYSIALTPAEVSRLYTGEKKINVTNTTLNYTAEVNIDLGTSNFTTSDINRDTYIDGFMTIGVTINDTGTAPIDLYFSNATANRSNYYGSFPRNNTNLSIVLTINVTNNGAYNNYSLPIQTMLRTNPERRVVEFQLRSTANLTVFEINANFTRRSEWDRVERGMSNQIVSAYGNTTEAPVCNQWSGGVLACLRAAKRFSNATLNASCLQMLNNTITGNNVTTGEIQGVCKENSGDSGNYQSLNAGFWTEMSIEFPFTMPYLDGPMALFFNLSTMKIASYNGNTQETAYGTRTALNGSILAGNSILSFYGNQSIVPLRVCQLSTNNTRIDNLTASGVNRYTTMDPVGYLLADKYWRSCGGGTATLLPQENDSVRLFTNLDQARIFMVKTLNTVTFGTYGYDYPRGQIADIYDHTGNHYVSGKEASLTIAPFNFSSGNFSNLNDVYQTLTVNSATYPVNITINGRLKTIAGATKVDSDDGGNFTDGVDPSAYVVLHTTAPNGRLSKVINLTSLKNTTSAVYMEWFIWSNYGNTMTVQVNGNTSCSYGFKATNSWHWVVTKINDGCIIDGLNTFNMTSFGATEQIRVAYNPNVDLDHSAGSLDAGATWNVSNINPRTTSIQNGELAVRMFMDTTDSPNSIRQTMVFYDWGILNHVQTDILVNLTAQFLSKNVIGAGTLLANNAQVLGNISYVFNNITATYNDTSKVAELGTVDELYMQGSTFDFVMGLIPNRSDPQYTKDANNATLALPIYVSNLTPNTKQINSTLPFSVSNITIVMRPSVAPSNPSLALPDGTTQNVSSFFFDSSTNVTSLTIPSLPPGLTVVSLDAAGPVVSLTSPADGSASLGGTVGFSFVPVESNAIANCSLLSGAGLVYTTSTSVANNASNTFVVSGIDDHHALGGAPLVWSVSCTDVFGNVGTSSTFSVVTATGSPGTGGGSGGSGGSGSSVTNASVLNASATTNVTLNESGMQHLVLAGESVDAQAHRNLIIVIVCGVIVVLIVFVAVGIKG